MPRVNVKYSFEKDALIDTIEYIKFQGIKAEFWKDRIASNKYEGKVEYVPVTNVINIEVKVYGQPKAEWILDAKIYKLKEEVDSNGKPLEDIDPIKIKGLPVSDKISNNTIGYHDKDYIILWR